MALSFSPSSFTQGVQTTVTITSSGTGSLDLTTTSFLSAMYLKNGSMTPVAWSWTAYTPMSAGTAVVEITCPTGTSAAAPTPEPEAKGTPVGGPPATGALTISIQDGEGNTYPIPQWIRLLAQ